MNKQWKYLEKRPNSSRNQLYLKGRKLLASIVWSDMIVNNDTIEETAVNWDLPVEAIEEAIEYCQQHQELIEFEALQEKEYLESKGYNLEPKIVN